MCAGIWKRCQYYFIWSLSEAGLNAAGFGFNGFADSDKREPKFDKFKNADPYMVRCHCAVATAWSQPPCLWARRDTVGWLDVVQSAEARATAPLHHLCRGC